MPQATTDEEEFIVQHGGLLSSIVECFTFQIGKRESSFKESLFHPGTVYDFKWLLDSVE